MPKIDLIVPGLLSLVNNTSQWSNLVKRLQTQPLVDQNEAFIADFMHFAKQPIASIVANVNKLVNHGRWLIATPISLQADQRAVYANPLPINQFSLQETEQLATELNQLFKTDGIIFHPIGTELLIESSKALNITTTPLYFTRDKNIAGYLPVGTNKTFWHKLFTEIQMLLYQHPLNVNRQKNALPTIDALWCWGEGEIVDYVPVPWRNIYSDSNWLKYYATYYKINYNAIMDDTTFNLFDLQFESDCMLFIECLSQQLAYEHKHFIAQRIIDFITHATSNPNIKVRLYPEEGNCYYLSPPKRTFLQRIKKLLSP